jgi:hypothetical protein
VGWWEAGRCGGWRGDGTSVDGGMFEIGWEGGKKRLGVGEDGRDDGRKLRLGLGFELEGLAQDAGCHRGARWGVKHRTAGAGTGAGEATNAIALLLLLAKPVEAPAQGGEAVLLAADANCTLDDEDRIWGHPVAASAIIDVWGGTAARSRLESMCERHGGSMERKVGRGGQVPRFSGRDAEFRRFGGEQGGGRRGSRAGVVWGVVNGVVCRCVWKMKRRRVVCSNVARHDRGGGLHKAMWVPEDARHGDSRPANC